MKSLKLFLLRHEQQANVQPEVLFKVQPLHQPLEAVQVTKKNQVEIFL